MRVRQEKMSGRRSAGNVRANRRRRMCARHILRNESAANLRRADDEKRAENDCSEVRDGWRCGCQDVDWPRFRMRMMPFHVHYPLVIRSFQLREMRMNERRPAGISMDMEQRSVSRSKNQGGH